MASRDQELEELLDKYEVKQRGKRDNRDQAITDEDRFVAQFDEIRLAVIRPGMERLGRQIRARDHDFKITEGEFQRVRGSIAVPDEAWIKMTIYLAHEQDRTEVGDPRRPHMTFTTDHRSKKVFVHMSDMTGTGGTTYKEGEYALNQMSPLFVQEKFLALFSKLARK